MNTDKTLALLLSCFSGERLMGLMDQALELQAAQTASGIDKMDLTELQALQIYTSSGSYSDVRANFGGLEPEPERRANVVKLLRWAADNFEGKEHLDG